MKGQKLFSNIKVGPIELHNRMVMAPMTRCRAIGNIPNELMALYYKQRAGAGLIITEGTSPSPNGLGYARIPGIFSTAQIEGWKRTTEAVHIAGGKVFVQLMHTGRISHPLNLPEGAEVLAPSAIRPAGEMWTDAQQMQAYPVPREMSGEDIVHAIAEYVTASMNAIKAYFDGVELHAANGYLLEQFLSPVTNHRTDRYGGSVENRCRFVLEVATAVAAAIGHERVGIRLSPYGLAGDMAHYPEIDATYDHLSKQLSRLDIAYIHLLDHSAMGGSPVPAEMKAMIRSNFNNRIILCGGYDKDTAENAIAQKRCDMVAFGRPYINNPDLYDRYRNNEAASTELHMDTFYTAGAIGYTDYPTYMESKLSVAF
jgi:N-ethylmaleimide reductase